MSEIKRLGGGLRNEMTALGYNVRPPSDPEDGSCWEMVPPGEGSTIWLAKDEAEGWEKASEHFYNQAAASALHPFREYKISNEAKQKIAEIEDHIATAPERIRATGWPHYPTVKQDTLAEETVALDVFLAAYAHHPDGEVIASVIDPTDDLLTLGQLRRILAALRTDGEANSRAVPSGEAVEDFIQEARLHAADMPPVIQRDYLNTALDKLAALSASKPDDASALLKEAYRQGWQDCAEDVLTGTHKDAMNEGAQNYLDASIGRDGA